MFDGTDTRAARVYSCDSPVPGGAGRTGGNTIAARYRARALTLLTVSDHIKRGEATSAQEREQTFSQMIEIALDTITA
jgi:hypothetical protein